MQVVVVYGPTRSDLYGQWFMRQCKTFGSFNEGGVERLERRQDLRNRNLSVRVNDFI